MKKISVNQFNKGLNLDNNPVSVSNDSLIGALNATFITKNGNEVVLQNDMGNASVDKAQLPAGYVPLGAKEHGGIIYVASYNPLTDESQIGCFPSPQRNFASDSDINLGFKSLCQYITDVVDQDFNHNVINQTYEQKIVNINDDNIIRPGDKFIITATDAGQFESEYEFIRLKALVVTENNQIIDITNQITKPTNSFQHVDFVKNISNGNPILDSDYTIYNNRTSGQLCLRAELIIPSSIELTYNNSKYNKISEIFSDNTIVNDWNSRYPNNPITADTYVTKLDVKVNAYDENGEVWRKPISYANNVSITEGNIYCYLSDNSGNFYYIMYGNTDNSIIKFNYAPWYDYHCSRYGIISSLKKHEEIEASLIGSGKVVFDTFKYYNNFDSNTLTLKYGIKFYNNNSDYNLTDLYLELLNYKEINNSSWNNINDAYDSTKAIKIPLNRNQYYGTYTEDFEYGHTLMHTINSQQSTDWNNLTRSNSIFPGQLYIARLCGKVNNQTLYKGKWYALITSEVTNEYYSDNNNVMIELEDRLSESEITLEYTLNDTSIYNDGEVQETLTGNVENYFSMNVPQDSELNFEVRKTGLNKSIYHSAKVDPVLPKYFPFGSFEMTYDNRANSKLSSFSYQDNITLDGNYNTSNLVNHHENVIIENIRGAFDRLIDGNKNEIHFQSFTATGGPTNIHYNYNIYSQLKSPFDSQQHRYNGRGGSFVSYTDDAHFRNIIEYTTEIDDDNRLLIYPLKMLYWGCEFRGPFNSSYTNIGLSEYVKTNLPAGDSGIETINPIYRFKNDESGIYTTTSNEHFAEFNDFLRDQYQTEPIIIFSSYKNESSRIWGGKYDYSYCNIYDMILMRGNDNNFYLLSDFKDEKGLLLKSIKDAFSNIYIYNNNEDVDITYYTGNSNNYVASNYYSIILNHIINYIPINKDININNYDSNDKKLDGKIIKLPSFKMDIKGGINKNYTTILNPTDIREKVSHFLNGVTFGSVAKVQTGGTYKYLLSAKNDTPLNEDDVYILDDSDPNNIYLENCNNIDASITNNISAHVALLIKEQKLIKDGNYLILNTNNVSDGIIPPTGFNYFRDFGERKPWTNIRANNLFAMFKVKAIKLL